MKILSVVGARPEFVQIAALSRAIRRNHEEILVHTGQHYDDNLSADFFRSLGLPDADINLGVGSLERNHQIDAVAGGLQKVIDELRPDWIVVRGDTNSTLGAALAAARASVPLAHVEAGERSGDMSMPEEQNRTAVDRIARLHFCASRTALKRLAGEGIVFTAHWTGDVMMDAFRMFLPAAQARTDLLPSLGVRSGAYALLTLHRAENVDNPERLASILDGVKRSAEPVVFPVHPRTRQRLATLAFTPGPQLKLIAPVGYLEMLHLEANARLIATDSGGVQREAYFHGVPCLTLRDVTEWTETIDAGWNRLTGADPDRIAAGFRSPPSAMERPSLFGDGFAAEAIADILSKES